MVTVCERAQQAYAETLDATIRIQVFGQPTDAILETLRQQAGSGVEISVNGAGPECRTPPRVLGRVRWELDARNRACARAA